MDNTPEHETPAPRRLGVRLAVIHTALFLLVALVVYGTGHPDASALFVIFAIIDYPVWDLKLHSAGFSLLWTIPVMGGLYWFSIGFFFRAMSARFQPGGFRRLGLAVLLLAGVCALPQLAWACLPAWERHWHRGTAAAEDGKRERAIFLVTEAIRVSPPGNELLGGMWDYLGRLQRDAGNADAAEAALTRALEWETSRAEPNPSFILSAWNELALCGRLSGERVRRAGYLRKAMEQARIVYGGDSTQEAHCLAELAEIAHEDGNQPEARALLARAIAMREGLPDARDGAAKWEKQRLAEWSAE